MTVRRPNVRTRVFCEVPLGFGMIAQMSKPKATAQQDLRNRAPTFIDTFVRFAKAAQQAESLNEVKVVSATMPTKEIRAVARFLRDHTTGLLGYVEEDGTPVAWRCMNDAERLDFYDELGSDGLMSAYGHYLGKTISASNPDFGRAEEE